MNIEYGRPVRGTKLSQTRELLALAGLDWDENVNVTVNITENDVLCATGSRQENVIKCVAASPQFAGEGYIAAIITELLKDAHADGFSHVFLFTKPQNADIFGGLGFYPVTAASGAVLMENRRGGIASYVASLKHPDAAGAIGAVVANCNPFTNGHRYLVETAASRCDFVYLFILSEDRSDFSAEARFMLAKEAVGDLKNVAVCQTGDYLVSFATFPDYFIKDKARAKEINYELDLAIFAESFASPLGITRRYVGSEPTCAVTAGYNRQMHKILPAHGIEVIEIPRCAHNGSAVSASAVRKLLAQGNLAEVKQFVPQSVYRYLERTCKNEPQ